MGYDPEALKRRFDRFSVHCFIIFVCIAYVKTNQTTFFFCGEIKTSTEIQFQP